MHIGERIWKFIRILKIEFPPGLTFPHLYIYPKTKNNISKIFPCLLTVPLTILRYGNKSNVQEQMNV